MRTVILAGGRGSRLQELTGDLPKPMVTIGGEPMLAHIMGIYARFGYTDFVIAGGYKCEVIGDWLDRANLPYSVKLVDTGLDTTTGGRIKRLERHLSDRFFLTYGDGLADIDIQALLDIHQRHDCLATITAIHPPPRFGRLVCEGHYVTSFDEKPTQADWINGGFFVVEPEAIELIEGDEAWEGGALPRLAARFLLGNYRHCGFWRCMDTLRDREALEALWKEGAPWIG